MTFCLNPSLEEIKEYLEEVTLKQSLETGLIYPLGTISTGPRAHNFLQFISVKSLSRVRLFATP